MIYLKYVCRLKRNLSKKARKTMKKNTISNDCKNCAYFVVHYANLDGEYYEVTGCQHCINNNLKISERKKRLNNLVVC